MLTLYRGLVAALLVAGLAVLGGTPVTAQAKKDDKKDPVAKKDLKDPKKAAPGAPDTTREKTVSFATSDGLALSGYWFQGGAIEKQRPDAVLMFPAPGNKITDTWIDLAKKLSQNNFSVLLFDWRGCGMNGPEAGSRVFESPERFWKENYNNKLLQPMKASVNEKGLDYKVLIGRGDSQISYRDWFMNDLLGARFFLDKQNDNGKCNTNRVWIVTEKDGANLGLSFIASEFNRNSIYQPNMNTFGAATQWKAAGKDYVGLTALSYATGGVFGNTANKVFKNALPEGNSSATIKEAKSHLEQRLAMVLLYSKKEGATASRSLINKVGSGTTEDIMKRNFKYLREIDTKTSAVSGIGMVDSADSFQALAEVARAMSEISKDKQTFGKDPTDREANKMTTVPRFEIERYSRNR